MCFLFSGSYCFRLCVHVLKDDGIRTNHLLCCLLYRSFKLRWKQVSNSTQLIQPINFDPKNRPRRQDWAGELVETGMFYFARKQLIKNQGLLQNHRLLEE